MTHALTRRLLAGALAVGLVAGGPALATAPGGGIGMAVPAQAEATAGWTRHTALGLSLWLPPEFEERFAEEDGVVYGLYGTAGLGEMEIVVTHHPDAFGEIMEELEALPADIPVTRTSRTIGSLGAFEQIDIDLTGDAEDPGTGSILVAQQADADAGRLIALVFGYDAMDGTTPDWDRIRAMIDEIMDRITDAGA